MKHIVTGLTMQPYSFAAWLTLDNIDSPFLRKDRTCTLTDVQLAAKICADKNPLAASLAATLADRILNFWLRSDEESLRQEAQSFVCYLDAHPSLPPTLGNDATLSLARDFFGPAFDSWLAARKASQAP